MKVLLRRFGVPALAAVLVAVGLVGWWAAYDARTAPAVQNLAVHDTTATAEVREEVSRALVSVLSYDHADPAAATAAADRVLSGAAREEYDELVATLHEKAPGQQLVLTAEVQAVGVKELSEDSAELLVLLDQSSRRVDDQEASISAAQLAVQASRSDGRWRITGLTPL
ncbi:hypothetical protein [Nocardioides pantholopis]|uniref:hypothetical protein n=1 Tax=Nocardioides pantholopis TaxID=2483798 RepID=UPI000F09493C|nr:hypothetical protein [Nocardioides pantholopis]